MIEKKKVAAEKGNPLGRRAVLGCLHQGLGHSHYEGLMAAMNVQPVAASMFKRVEREVGRVIEETASESCEKWREEEKCVSTDGGVKVSFDQGWQKQGHAHNSKTGQGTLVGFETGKCVDFDTKNTYCRKCLEAEKKCVTTEPHDCRRNHYGSSKAMEAAVAVELFGKEQYSVLIVISKLREEVHSGIEKWSEVNHATCTMTKALYEGQGTNFGANSDKITD